VSLSYSFRNQRNPQSTAFYELNEVFVNFSLKLHKQQRNSYLMGFLGISEPKQARIIGSFWLNFSPFSLGFKNP
jgi:hypothetical protein